MSHEQSLIVYEFGGTARSGKGTIVRTLAERYEGVRAEETGADYRAVTFSLLQEKLLQPEMDESIIPLIVRELDPENLTDMVANRNNLVEAHGLDVLYTSEVGGLVHHVGAIHSVRKAVKAGFRRRVEAARDNPDYHTLLVDGRNLAPVVNAIPGTTLVMRTFVHCDAMEAAQRECNRSGITLRSDEGQLIYHDIRARNFKDADRHEDPVRPEVGALDYWQTGISRKELDSRQYHGDVTRVGVGKEAARTGRQILYDTTAYTFLNQPVERMLAAADQMFQEAQAAGMAGQLATAVLLG